MDSSTADKSFRQPLPSNHALTQTVVGSTPHYMPIHPRRAELRQGQVCQRTIRSERETGRHVSAFCLLDPDHYKLRDMAGVSPQTRVGYCYDPRMREHKHLSYDHLEQPARITSIFETLESSGCTSRMIVLPAREVSKDEVALVHSRNVWERVNAIECRVSSAFHLLGAYSVILSAFWLCVPHSTLALFLRNLQR